MAERIPSETSRKIEQQEKLGKLLASFIKEKEELFKQSDELMATEGVYPAREEHKNEDREKQLANIQKFKEMYMAQLGNFLVYPQGIVELFWQAKKVRAADAKSMELFDRAVEKHTDEAGEPDEALNAAFDSYIDTSELDDEETEKIFLWLTDTQMDAWEKMLQDMKLLNKPIESNNLDIEVKVAQLEYFFKQVMERVTAIHTQFDKFCKEGDADDLKQKRRLRVRVLEKMLERAVSEFREDGGIYVSKLYYAIEAVYQESRNVERTAEDFKNDFEDSSEAAIESKIAEVAKYTPMEEQAAAAKDSLREFPREKIAEFKNLLISLGVLQDIEVN